MKPTTRCCADETRDKILSVAKKLFTKKGFAGTSISDIADAAKINQSLIYHHFENKKNLWKVAKNSVLAKVNICDETGIFNDLIKQGFHAFIVYITQLRFKMYVNCGELIRMVSWQRLEPERKELQTMCLASFEDWYNAIVTFQKRGEIHADLDPDVVLSILWNSVSGLFLDHYPTFSQHVHDPKMQEKYIKMIADTLYRGFSTEFKKEKS